jgi:hypothetical protein
LNLTDVSKEHAAFTFRAEEQAKLATSNKLLTAVAIKEYYPLGCDAV